MDSDVLKKYAEAGRIAAEARGHAQSIVKPGAKLLDIAESLEKFIRDKGGEPAFPVNISINEIAAHYTPPANDVSVVNDGDVVKVDIGVHVDGYVGDTAVTVCFSEKNEKLCEASRAALEEAVPMAVPGARISNISAAIEKVITDYGYKPVSNLTGHGLDRYVLHDEPKILNVAHSGEARLSEGQVIAIEPFATDGAGFVKDSGDVFIFSLARRTPARSEAARAVMRLGAERSGMPFAERWVSGPLFSVRMALRELRERNALVDYAVLREAKGGVVSQAEHTIIVKEEPLVTTK